MTMVSLDEKQYDRIRRQVMSSEEADAVVEVVKKMQDDFATVLYAADPSAQVRRLLGGDDDGA